MLSGRLPFIPSTADPLALVAMQAEEDPPPLRARRPDVSQALEALVLLALSRNPETRPTADQLAQRLAHGRRRPLHPDRRSFDPRPSQSADSRGGVRAARRATSVARGSP